MDGLKKFYVTRVKGFEPYKIAVATLVFEGNAEEVAAQEKRVYEIASNYGYDTSPTMMLNRQIYPSSLFVDPCMCKPCVRLKTLGLDNQS